MKGATATMQSLENSSGPQKPCGLYVPTAGERALPAATCRGVCPTLQPPLPLPGFLPCPPWWLDPLLGALSRLTSSSRCPRAASGTVARLASLDAAGFPD